MTSKALDVIKNALHFEHKFEIVEGEYVYGRDGSIVRVDRPSAPPTPSTREPQDVLASPKKTKEVIKKDKQDTVQPVSNLFNSEDSKLNTNES